MKSRRLRRATWWSAAILALSSVVYPLAVRPWHQRWGATQEEVARRMAGDDDVKRPIEVTTRAVPVAARPEHIWPWLMQARKSKGWPVQLRLDRSDNRSPTIGERRPRSAAVSGSPRGRRGALRPRDLHAG